MFKSTDHLITHFGCMDGAACAIVFLHFGGKQENIHFASPAHAIVDPLALDTYDNLEEGGILLLADISVSEAAAKELNSNNSRDNKAIQLLDHHKSALPLRKYSWCDISENNTMCGARLLLLYCNTNFSTCGICDMHGGPLKLWDFVSLVDDHDRWIHADPRSTLLADLFTTLGQTAFIERFGKDTNPSLTPEETYAVQIEQNKKKEYLERLDSRCLSVTENNKMIGYVTCEQKYVSDAGYYLYTKYDFDAVVLITLDTISLRAPAHSSLDMAEIAKKYGGGGHKGAAGFPLKSILGDTLSNRVRNWILSYDA